MPSGASGRDDDATAMPLDPSAEWADALGGFARHLGAERGLSIHTIRAYTSDLRALSVHATAAGRPDPAQIDLLLLRSWLAGFSAAGHSRSSLARRAASAKAFTRWLARTGRAPADPVGAAEFATRLMMGGLDRLPRR